MVGEGEEALGLADAVLAEGAPVAPEKEDAVLAAEDLAPVGAEAVELVGAEGLETGQKARQLAFWLLKRSRS